MKKAIAILLLILLLGGCSSTTEIDKLMIVSGMSIDKRDDGYKIITQIVNMANSDQNELSPILLESKGTTIVSALRTLPGLEGQRLYFTHAQVILVSEEYMRSIGVEHLINLINLEPRFRSSINLAVTSKNASEVIATEPKTDPISCFSIADSIKESEAMLLTPNTPFYKFLNESMEPGIDGILPIVSSVNGKDKANLPKVGGTALFKEYKMIGSLTEKQTKYLLIARNTIPRSIYSTESHSFLINDGSTKLSTVDDKITLTIKMELSLLEGEKYSENELAEIINNDCKKGVEDLILSLQELGCDPIGIGRYIKRHHYSTWKKIYPENWDSFYNKLNININVESSIVPSSKLTGDKK